MQAEKPRANCCSRTKTLLVAVAILSYWPFHADTRNQAQALSCAQRTFEEDYNRATYVFLGLVTKKSTEIRDNHVPEDVRRPKNPAEKEFAKEEVTTYSVEVLIEAKGDLPNMVTFEWREPIYPPTSRKLGGPDYHNLRVGRESWFFAYRNSPPFEVAFPCWPSYETADVLDFFTGLKEPKDDDEHRLKVNRIIRKISERDY